MIASCTRCEGSISRLAVAWLPFESQEELEQARSEAEAEAEKLLEEAAPKSTSKPKKKRSEALPLTSPK